MTQKTAMSKAIEMLDSQISIVDKSKKGKDAKYKFGADASITNLVIAKMTLKGLLELERTQIEQAYCYGYMEGYNGDAEDKSDYYTKTYNNE